MVSRQNYGMDKSMTKRFISLLLALAFLLSACAAQPTVAPASTPTPLVIPSATVIPPTQAPSEKVVPAETAAPTATATPSVSGLPDYSASAYLDDRSTAAALMLSYFNAINRHEYLRAYSYYTNNTNIGTLEEFSSGNSNTQSTSVVFGLIYGEGAAGSLYFTVPMILNVNTNLNTQQKFAACYVLRLPQPGNYGSPPITPMHIERRIAKSVPLTTTDSVALASACPSPDFPTGPNSSPAAVEQLTDLSNANYIDDRSDATTVLSSYVNAINHNEYVRAYSYWQIPPGTYKAFAAGYVDTASVTAQFGTAIMDVNDAQTSFSLPVILIATMTDGSINTYAGCYVMQLTQPEVQTTIPFQPLGITRADVKLVDNTAVAASLLATACQ